MIELFKISYFQISAVKTYFSFEQVEIKQNIGSDTFVKEWESTNPVTDDFLWLTTESFPQSIVEDFPWFLFLFTLLSSVTIIVVLWRGLYILFEWRRTAEVHQSSGEIQ